MELSNNQAREKMWFDAHGQLHVFKVWETIQGEGPHVGRPAVFVRLSGCNLQCPLCDTDYTSRRELLLPDDLMDLVRTQRSYGLVVITGGEPFRQNIAPFAKLLLRERYDVQVETNGTFSPGNFPPEAMIVCSPKTPGIHPAMANKIHAFKYVLQAGYVDERDGLPTRVLGMDQKPARPVGFNRPIYLQPCDEKDEVKNKLNLDATIRSCLRFGYTFCLQTHKLIGLE